jgi:sugar lactone lactonase YvrE
VSTTRNVLAIAVLFGAAAARAQGVIESVAGGGPGNGSPALAVNLRTPQEVVRDSSGNLYIAVSDDRRVYRIGTDGNISLIAGGGGSGTDGDGGPATAAELVSPKGLAIDFDGSLLIADEGARRVRRVDLGTGSISTLVGGGSLTGEGVQALQLALDAPRDLAVQGSSALYVADGHRVRKLVRASGLVSTVAGTGVAGFSDGANATTRQLNEPRALAFDPTGKLLIADGGNGRIRRLDLAANSISTVVSGVCSPGGVAVDAAGTVYFTSNTGSCGSSSQKYMKWVSGSPTTLAASGSSFVAQLSVLPDGSLVAADRDSFRIRSISVGGSVTNLAGNGTIGYYGDGVPALSASYLSPTHVRADAVGNLYVVDNTNRIRRVTPAEIDVTLASTANCGSDPKSYLCSVEGLAILPGGDLAFSESKNDMLHRINPATGVVTDLTTSALGRVRGIASSAAGFVYVADRGPGASNGSIKKVNATTGAVSDVATGLARPQYVAVDGSANVYFVSVNASSIQKISAEDGSASTWITLTSAVTGLDADDAGNLYVTDSNNQVWLVAAGTAVKSLFAGSGVAGFSGDGGPAVAARLSGPSGVSYVTGGDVYIADTLNYRIRRVRQNHNLGPLASAGPDQTVEATSPSGASVTLDGSGSSDPDGDPLTYSWSGPFGSASGASPSVNLPLGTHTITLTVSDGSATASDTVVVILQDTTGPQVTYVRSPLPNAHGWNNTNVTLSFSCADSASGVPEAASAPVVVSAEGAGQSRSHTCTDVAGNSASVTVSDINIDKTAPTPTATRLPAANANGWNRTDVTVTFTAVDDLSGIDACDAAKLLSDEAANQSASGSCSDKAGNGASATASGISIDKTAPSLSFAAASPGANSNGWNNGDVTFAFTTSDGLSGVDTTSIPSPLVLTGEGSALSGTVDVTDRAGNSASFPSPTVKIDRTGPVVSGSRSPLANVYGWNNTDVTATFSATDALSGLGSCEEPVVVSAEGASQTVTRSCTDQAGNSASATVSDINIDKTAPTPTATRLPAANANGWNRTDVTVTFTAVDDLSGVDACDAPKLLSNEAADQSASGSCSDKAGNTASATASDISIDKTNPSLSFGPASPSANANGWNNGSVTFAFTTSDALSGVDTTSIPSPLVLTGEGNAVSGTVDVTDRAGNSASFPSPTVKIDKTAPVVSGSRSPLANIYGWNNSDVTASFSATDALSGLGSCDAPVVVTGEGASQTVTRSCTDQAGNSASATVSDINIDKTAPSVTGAPARPADHNGWYNHAISVTWSANDPLSGVAACSSASSYSGPDALVATVTGHCSDKAGNEGTGTQTLKYDATAPTVSITTPPSGATYTLDQSVTAHYSCADNLSGVSSCSGPVADGAAVSTSPVGSKSFKVDAMDTAGNTASLTNNYSIKYQFVGFLQPVDNLPVVNVATAGRTIPIKWQLKKASGGYVTELSSFVSLLWAPLACDASPTDIVEEETTATGGTTLRYDPVANQFIYNWDTQKSWARTCVQIQLTLADGTRQFAKVSFK